MPVASARRPDTGAVGEVAGSRLRPERPLLPLVPRTRLVDRLVARRRPLAVVTAPAGWGKSSLIAEWIGADPRPSAWLRLEAADDELVVLLTDLSLALAPVASLDPALPGLLRRRRPPIAGRILPALAAGLAEAPPFVLVLDDAHAVESPQCWSVLRSLVEELGPGSTVALGTRSDPPLDLDRLRAADALDEVRAHELALDSDELQRLLELRDVRLDPEAAAGLLRLTEGWPAGVTLALLAVGERERGARPNAWDRGAIASYLTSEVLARQEAPVRDFLLRTSLLDRLSAPLCRAITGRDDARSLLEACVHGNVFLTALDDEGTWFRCHPLFRDLLRAELDREAPDEVGPLHHRAAAWFAAHDEPEEAIRHWLAADDVDAAVDLVVATCDRWLCDGDHWRARRLLAQIPEEDLRSRPSLTLAAGWVAMVSGDEALVRRWGVAAGRADVGDGPSPDGAASRRSSQHLLRAALALDGIAQMRADAEEGAALEAGRPGSWHAFALLRLGIARYLAGEGEAARAPLEEVLAAGELPEQVDALGYLALLAADEGRTEDAERAGRAIVAREPSILTEDLGEACDLVAAVAAASVELRDRPERTAELLDRLGAQFDARPRLPRGMLVSAVLIGELSAAHGELERARFWATRARHLLAEYPQAGILRERTERLVATCEALSGIDAPTPAELRVLALLPTHLSHREIGERLFVSTNTVRTHLRHLYAKLEVTTRADAVRRAEELGLLRPEHPVRITTSL